MSDWTIEAIATYCRRSNDYGDKLPNDAPPWSALASVIVVLARGRIGDAPPPTPGAPRTEPRHVELRQGYDPAKAPPPRVCAVCGEPWPSP